MKKIITLVMIAALTVTAFVGCSKPAAPAPADTKPATTTPADTKPATTTPATTNGPKDGTYTAEDTADSHGYKGVVSVTYKDGKLTNVTFDEVTKDGKKKRDDANYNSQMKSQTKVSAVEAQDKLTKTYLDNQKVDTVTGATEMSARFKTLVEKAIASSK
ncbi:FMN-binding protein [Candidatus Clostridium stratigraminis]|uniref:FMN-binding protein n=1 Tax=Candidatus Clostridium stratigraminis TaxID=3381661 RepID=A0ABW8T5H6_9CLOT